MHQLSLVTLQCFFPTGYAPVFGVALARSLPNTQNLLVNFTVELGNYYRSFNMITARFASQTLAWYYVEICSGIQVSFA
jgi:hypothetical protein